MDGSKLALWGVSYAGGHSLVTAARLGTDVSAVVANVSAGIGSVGCAMSYADILCNEHVQLGCTGNLTPTQAALLLPPLVEGAHGVA